LGFIGGLLGAAGGASGSGFQAANGQNPSIMQQPTTTAQANTAYGQTQTGLQQQQQFLQALQAQNGIQNQQSVYNQLQGVANGTGPNPAQAQLAQATSANVANQAALMAGQRGSNANVGLMARQASQQGAQTQQQSAGQAATLQAQQSLGALNSMQGLATNQVGQQANATNSYMQSAQGSQSALLGAIAGQNATAAGLQSNINTNNTALAGQQMAGQQNMLGGLAGAAGAAMLLAAEGGEVPQSAPQHYAEGTPYITPVQIGQNPINQTSSNMSGPQSNVGQYLNGQSSSSSPSNSIAAGATMPQARDQSANYASLGKGLISQYNSSGLDTSSSSGDQATGNNINQVSPDASYAQNGIQATPDVGSDPYSSAAGSSTGGLGSLVGAEDSFAKGGKVPAMVSPGEQYLPPKDVEKVKKGSNPLKVGEKIPGKPKYKGNDYRNDTVKKNLESGGIVIPNEIMQSKRPHFEAMKFVHAHIAKHRGLPPKGK
jgi:hypothetical protein